MIADARREGDTPGLETGVCILGAGAAGITLARALDAAGVDRVLLEGGGFQWDPSRPLYVGHP